MKYTAMVSKECMSLWKFTAVKQTWAIEITVRWCPQRLPSF